MSQPFDRNYYHPEFKVAMDEQFAKHRIGLVRYNGNEITGVVVSHVASKDEYVIVPGRIYKSNKGTFNIEAIRLEGQQVNVYYNGIYSPFSDFFYQLSEEDIPPTHDTYIPWGM